MFLFINILILTFIFRSSNVNSQRAKGFWWKLRDSEYALFHFEFVYCMHKECQHIIYCWIQN